MHQPEHPESSGRWTRARLLRNAVGGSALLAGAVTTGVRSDDGSSVAAPSKGDEREILNLFLLLERVQEGFYAQALRGGRLTGDLLEFAKTVGPQETEHVAFLVDRLGSEAGQRPTLDFPAEALASPERFRDTAIELEELTIAAYIGQGANLARATTKPIASMLAVEARQAAWVRDLAGVSPAPETADPGRDPEEILDDLRSRGLIR